MAEKPKVLIVDDEEIARISISNVLKDDCEVESVSSGGEAVSKLKDKNFDVVLLDIRMPKMWGTEALRKIKELNKELEVIMLTALDDAQNAWESSKYGAFDYITKPFKDEDLIFRIKLAANRVAEKRKTGEEQKSIINIFRIYEKYPQIYGKVLSEFGKAIGSDRLMNYEETKEWFSEKKLREIFGREFNRDWLPKP